LDVRICSGRKGEVRGRKGCGHRCGVGGTRGKSGSVHRNDRIIVGCLGLSGCVHVRGCGSSCDLCPISKYFIANDRHIICARRPIQVDLVRGNSRGCQTRWGGRRGGIGSVPVTGARACICEGLAGFRHELPAVTGWMQCQLEHSIRIDIADFTVCGNARK
jgi:hypothetical protein